MVCRGRGVDIATAACVTVNLYARMGILRQCAMQTVCVRVRPSTCKVCISRQSQL